MHQVYNLGRKAWVIFETESCWGLELVIILHERGIPSKRESSARIDYVPALCTHRPSHLPIEWSGEIFGPRDVQQWSLSGKLLKPYHLEEGEVVTRFP